MDKLKSGGSSVGGEESRWEGLGKKAGWQGGDSHGMTDGWTGVELREGGRKEMVQKLVEHLALDFFLGPMRI